MSVFEGAVFPPQGLAADRANIYKRAGRDDPWVLVRRVDVAEPFTLDLTEGPGAEIAAAFVVAGREQPEELWARTAISTASTSELTTIESVPDFVVSQDGPDIVARWTASDHPYIDHYELSTGADIAQRVVWARVPWPGTEYRMGWWGTGSTKFFLVAVSAQGQRSTQLEFTLTIVAEPMVVEQASVDEHGGGFTGTKANVEVSSGDLRIAAVPAANAITTAANLLTWPLWGAFVGSGTYVTAWQDVGAVVREKIQIDATFDDDTVVPAASDPMPPIEPRWENGTALRPGHPSLLRHVDGAFALLTDYGVKIEIDTAQDGTPTPDGFRLWVPGSWYTYQQVRLRVTLSMPWCYATPKITSFTWRRLRRNLKDEGEASIVGTGGTTVVFAQPFSVAPQVVASVVGANGWVAQANNITATGCDVRAYNPAGTEQGTATVHWHALGV